MACRLGRRDHGLLRETAKDSTFDNGRPSIMWLDDLNVRMDGFKTSLEILARTKSTDQEDSLLEVRLGQINFSGCYLYFFGFRVPFRHALNCDKVNLIIYQSFDVCDQWIKDSFDILPIASLNKLNQSTILVRRLTISCSRSSTGDCLPGRLPNQTWESSQNNLHLDYHEMRV
jgi:hypothetical protein